MGGWGLEDLKYFENSFSLPIRLPGRLQFIHGVHIFINILRLVDQ